MTDKAVQVREVVQGCLERYARGQAPDDQEIDRLLGSHPELLPELAAELGKLRRVRQAGERALGGASTVSRAGEPSTGPWSGAASDGPPPDLPDYELIRPVGRGSFGAVWVARNRHDGQFCAVKVVPAAHAIELDGVRAYKSRCQDHPALLAIRHVGQADGYLYYSMPLADDAKGAAVLRPVEDYEPLTLQGYLTAHAPLPVDEVLAIADHLLAGLDHLHQAGLLHKDVKPANVLRVKGTWRLGDMGLTACSGPNQARACTPAFSPPEGPCDRTADLFALGKTLYLALTGAPLAGFGEFTDGQLPMPGDDARREALRGIILRTCAGDPGQRFARAEDLRQALRILTPRKKRKSPIAWVACAVVLLSVAGIGAFAWQVGSHRPSSAVDSPFAGLKDVKDRETPGPLRVQKLDVTHLAKVGRRDQPRGLLGVRSFAAKGNDAVTVQAELSAPAYGYLVAYRPDGTAEVCFPEDATAAPRLTTQPGYPSVNANRTYGLEEGAGLMAFVLVASRRPLPAYAEWEKQHGHGPWRKADAAAGVVWRLDGGQLLAVTADDPGGDRGKGRELAGAGSLGELIAWWRAAPDVEAVAAVAFPVLVAGGD